MMNREMGRFRGWAVAVAVGAISGALGCGGSTDVDSSGGDASSGHDASGDAQPDAGNDGQTPSDVTVNDGQGPGCPLPPGDYASCESDNDCATAAGGCYCGPQPVYGVSKTHVAAVAACEAEAAASCMLGCMNQPWQVADDGQENPDGGTIKVHCVPWDGGPKSCKTYLE